MEPESGQQAGQQDEAGGQLEEAFRSVAGREWKCMRCAKADRLMVFSTEACAGALYISDAGRPGFDPGHLQLLCSRCRAQWMMWTARMGNDLHTHPAAAACPPRCLMRQGGRRLQHQSLMSLMHDRKAWFLLCKTIDEQPKVNGTFLIVAQRAGYYAGGAYMRQAYYESIGSADDVIRGMAETHRLRQAGVPLKALDRHLMVVEIFDSAYDAARGSFTHPGPGERSRGLHCIAPESFDEETQAFRFWNSWGPQWGKRGYGTMSLQYARDFYHEAWVLRHARWGPSPYKPRDLAEQTDPRETRRLWNVENPRLTGLIPGPGERNSRWRLYETLSPVTGAPVTCIEVTSGFGLRMGWAFVRFSNEQTPTAEITELYVWPTFRRLGIGSWLEATCADEALSRGCAEIRLLMNESDSVLPLRGAARAFAAARGYGLRWKRTVAPRTVATGTKRLDDAAARGRADLSA